MAFPQVAGTASNFSATATAPSVTLPGSIVAGDLLVAFLATNVVPVITWPGGWTELTNSPQDNGVQDRCGVAYRIADGSEGASISPTLSTNRPWASYAMRITGAHASQAPELSVGVQASTINPDPDALDPANWATEDTLWLACVLIGIGNLTVTSYPASYTNGTLSSTGTSGGVGFAIARRENAVASEDPGTFTIGASPSDMRAFTLALRPAAGGGTPHTHEVDDTLSITDLPTIGGAESVADTASVTDAQSRALVKAVAETLGVTDGGLEVDVGYVLADTASVTDQITLPGTNNWSQQVNDTMAGTDAQGRVWHAVRAVGDTATVTDGVTLPGARRWEVSSEDRWLVDSVV